MSRQESSNPYMKYIAYKMKQLSPKMIRLISWILFIVGVFCSVVIYTWITEPPGYCAAQKRYINDDEFINVAAQYNSDNMSAKSHSSIGNFYAANPDCCTVYRTNTKLFERFTSVTVNSVEVYLQFEINPDLLSKETSLPKYYETFTTIGICGEPLENSGIAKDIYYDLPKFGKKH